jgi:prepilin-type N-terminal cleavage/methylation domain-containing protein/prepilin-type processing-associated H-X9-DG protein
MKRADKAFTLVELLVVISIIAMLLAILMPALAKVREQGRAIVCASNIKNYGPCLIMYAQDNNGKCPFSFSWLYSMKTIFEDDKSGVCKQECRWHYDVDPPDGLLWPYMKTMDVHICPTFKNFAMAGGLDICPNKDAHSTSRSGAKMPFNPRYSYSMNRWLGMDWMGFLADPTLAAEPSLKLSNVTRTSQCFAFSEENLWTIDHRTGDRPKYYTTSALAKTDLWMHANKDYPDKAIANFATYHNVSAAKRNEGKANVLFVDGHVARIRGLAGRAAYMEYGRPFEGHEKQNNWQIW